MSEIQLDIPDISVLVNTSPDYKKVIVKPDSNYNVNIRLPRTSNKVSGSYILFAETALTSSYALTAQLLVSTGSLYLGQLTASTAYISQSLTVGGTIYGTSSYAITASYALNAGAGAGFPFSGSAVITGSLLVVNADSSIGGITASLLGTSSLAQNIGVIFAGTYQTGSDNPIVPTPSGGLIYVTSASYALTSSYASNADLFDGLNSTVFATTGSNTFTGHQIVNGGITGSLFGTASWANNSISSSFSSTASYALTAEAGAGFPFSGSAVITGSLLISSSGLTLIGRGITGSLLGTSSWANNAITASYIQGGIAISNGLNISGSLLVTGSETITGSLRVSQGITGSLLGTSSWAQNVISASFSTTSSFATTASFALNAGGGSGAGFPFSGSAVITGSLLVSGSGTPLQITGSANIRDNLTINGGTFSVDAISNRINFTGSTVVTGSLVISGSSTLPILQVIKSGSRLLNIAGSQGELFSVDDSLSGSLMSVNDITGLPILEVFSDDRVVMGTFNQNTLVVTGSRIGIDKATPTTDLDISGSVFITGSLRMNVGGITGSLLGTSSWAQNVISASFSTTSSFATTASFALNAGGGSGAGFPFSGSAVITGSLLVSGSGLRITGSTDILGGFTALTKSFKIQHQRKPGKHLIYGVLEGPEHSVFVRGKLENSNVIILPNEWEWLIDTNTITVQLTPIGRQQNLYVKNIDGLYITIENGSWFTGDVNCYYTVYATRKDIEPLETVV